MTLTQLEAFVLVARLGSVKAAARALGVSEPAVSGALASLRMQLGDGLVERSSTGMTLTAGGERLMPIASQMVALAAEAEEAIRRAKGAPERLRVVATSTVAESVAPALLAAFTARAGNTVEASLGMASSEEMAAVLLERLADVALGPRIAGEAAQGLECMPLFRYRLRIVCGPTHRLAKTGKLPLSALARDTWLVDPDATDPASPVQSMLRHLGVSENRISVFPSQTAALVAAQEGFGVAPAVAHLVAPELGRGTLVALDVERTPIDLLWYVTTLAVDRRPAAAGSLKRFISTPAATHAMHAPLSGVPPSRFRPPVYVTIWS